MSASLHPAAVSHLPVFITPPGEADVLMNVMIVFIIAMTLIIGNLYLRLHALPERMAHRTNKVQFQFVAVLALLALFTHNHIYWVAALLLALVRFPDLSGPLSSISESLERLANSYAPRPGAEAQVRDDLAADGSVPRSIPPESTADTPPPRAAMVIGRRRPKPIDAPTPSPVPTTTVAGV